MIPTGAHRVLHTISPFIAVFPIVISFAIIPYGGSYEAWGVSWQMVAADLDYGVLYIFAIGSIAAYGSMLAGWAGNNNWGIIGSIRVSAQMISYEVTMGVTVIGLFMVFQTVRLTDMGVLQQETFRLLGFLEHFGWVAAGTAWVDLITIPMWGIVLQPLGFLMFLTAVMAENKRPPFDTPEGENEIVAGYFIEYSGMKFGIYLMGEMVEVVVIAGLMTAMFLGGWSLPWISDADIVGFLAGIFGPNLGNVFAMLIAVGVFMAKVLVLIFFQMLLRWSLPRFRYDQVMNLGWKILLPLSLANIVITGLGILIIEQVTR
jgi:NADH-quinone oxidoreductase subunit H